MGGTSDSDEPTGDAHRDAASEDRVAEIHAQLKKFAIPPAMLERLFAFAPVGFQLYDASGRSLLTNRAYLEMFGVLPPPEYNVMEDEIAERNGVLDLIKSAFLGKVVRIPPVWYDPRELTRVKVTEGRRVAIDTVFFPVFDAGGRVTHVGVVFKDVSAELVAREEADAERDLLKTLVDQSGEGIIVADADGVLRIFNPEASRQHGRPLDEVGAERWTNTYGLEDEDGHPLPLEQTPLWRALHGEPVSNAYWVVRRPDGSRRLLAGTATPLRRPDGTIRGAMVITRDESERRQVAEERRIAQFKDRFIGILGHDLRVPLTAIKTATMTLRRKGSSTEEELRTSLGRLLPFIERGVDRMNRMIADVLDFTRIRMGSGIPLARRTTDLGAVALGVVEELRAIHPDQEIRVDLDGSLSGSWDEDRMAQVVQNLVVNALVHGDVGAPVRVTLDGTSEEVVLAVHNEGPRIPPELVSQMFDPLRRGTSPGGGREEGIGLGLFIVRALVEAHGGRIQVRSTATTGTSFVVKLPREHATP